MARNAHLIKSARAAYTKALTRGELVRPDYCFCCGEVGRIEGHHEDYSRPLSVMWLCTGCHGLADQSVSVGPGNVSTRRKTEFSHRIKSYRDREGVTLEAMARKLSLPTATVSRWERGKNNPTGLHRKRILAFLRRVGA